MPWPGLPALRAAALSIHAAQIAAGALGTDILKAVEAQPALLLQDGCLLDGEVCTCMPVLQSLLFCVLAGMHATMACTGQPAAEQP